MQKTNERGRSALCADDTEIILWRRSRDENRERTGKRNGGYPAFSGASGIKKELREGKEKKIKWGGTNVSGIGD